MTRLIVKNDPLAAPTRTLDISAGASVRQAIGVAFPGLVEFSTPTIVLVNSEPCLRNEWDDRVCFDEDEITIVHLPAGVGAIAAMQLTLTLASLVVSGVAIIQAKMLDRKLKAGSGAIDPPPVYTLEGKSNTAKIRQPIEVAYGKNRLWPSYVATPYPVYYSDYAAGLRYQHQDLYQLFCVGQGYFDIHAVQIEDTPITSFSGVTYEILDPGITPTLNPKIAHTIAEANDTPLTVGVDVGGFKSTPKGYTANTFAFDLTFPNGMAASVSETIRIEFYPLFGDDDSVLSNNPTYRDIVYTNNHLNSNSFTQTFTIDESQGIPKGRYLIHIKLIAASQAVTLTSFRSFYDIPWPIYPDKTMLIVKYSASNALNSTIQNKVNVIATRKLKVMTGTGTTFGESFQPTRSIPWAIYDVLTNKIYGGGLDEAFIDLPTLCRLHSELEYFGITFDNVFNQSTTVWDAVNVIARAGRCRLVPAGSQLSLIRDTSMALPMGVFSTENIIKDSFSWNVRLFDPAEPDGVELSYVDAVTGAQLTVDFIPDGSLGNNIEKVEVIGIGSKLQGWREAAYTMGLHRYARETISFKTGLEGFIPRIGDVVAISWPIPKFGTSGVVEGMLGSTLYLSQPVTFIDGAAHYILLRQDDGSAAGPYRVAEGSDPTEVVIIDKLDFVVNFERLDRDPVIFTFGPAENYAKKIKITNISPIDSSTVELTAVNYDQRVYAYDSMTIDNQNELQEYVNTPTKVIATGCIRRNSGSTNPVTILWSPVPKALSYEVTLTVTGGVPNLIYSGPENILHFELPMADCVIEVRALTPTGYGPSNMWAGVNGASIAMHAPEVLEYHFFEDTLSINWSTVIDADYYRVKFYRFSDTKLLRTIDTVGIATQYTTAMLAVDTLDGVCRDFTVEVTSINASGESYARVVRCPVVNPPAPTGVSVSSSESTTTVPALDLKWLNSGNTIVKYNVYADKINLSSGTNVALAPVNRLYTGKLTAFRKTGGISYWSFSAISKIEAYTHSTYGEGGILTVPTFNPNGYVPVGYLSSVYFIDGVPGEDREHNRLGIVMGVGQIFIKYMAYESATPIAGAKFYFPDNLTGATKIRGAIQVVDGWGPFSGDTVYFSTALPVP